MEEAESSKETCGCPEPSIRARWCYEGSRVVRAYAYCGNCDATWTYSHELKRLVRKEKEAA